LDRAAHVSTDGQLTAGCRRFAIDTVPGWKARIVILIEMDNSLILRSDGQVVDEAHEPMRAFIAEARGRPAHMPSRLFAGLGATVGQAAIRASGLTNIEAIASFVAGLLPQNMIAVSDCCGVADKRPCRQHGDGVLGGRQRS
jgi:hypothetical protein